MRTVMVAAILVILIPSVVTATVIMTQIKADIDFVKSALAVSVITRSQMAEWCSELERANENWKLKCPSPYELPSLRGR